MKSHDKMHQHSSGHSGHDSMREYADKMLGTSKASHVGSVRRFRDGGEVNHMEEHKMRRGGHHKEHHGAHHASHHRKHSKEGHPKYSVGGFFGDLMRSIPLINMVTGPIADAAHLKKGGKVHSRKHKADSGETKAEGGNMRRGGHHHHGHHHRKRRAEGGEMPSESAEAMRKGGHHGRRKYGLGGMIAGAAGAPLLNKIPKVGKYMAQNLGMFGGLLPFAEGGHAEGKESKRCGGAMNRKHKADGGSMYTYQGRPYTLPEGWANSVKGIYSEGGEAKRHGGGMRRKRRAAGGEMVEPALIANAKKRWADNHPNGELYAEGGETRADGGAMKHGGHHLLQVPLDTLRRYKRISLEIAPKKHKADGGKAGEAPFCSTERKEGGQMHRTRRAIGGPGKVRLGQSTPEGKPIGVRPARSK
jgi:hypothetical protein